MRKGSNPELTSSQILILALPLESTASFRTRAVGNGLTEAQITYLVNNGINSLSKMAFAATTPGEMP